MGFSNTHVAELTKPLSREHVKTNPRGYNYLEGWHAIAEANRIFGFDAWTRETLDSTCITAHERKVGKDQADGWGVTYVCKVRVTVMGVVREGTGAGHGIDRDLGLAHESAIKEAETDAMKRALMTFGNPFGLALYDKAQAGVEGAAMPAQTPRPQPARQAQSARPAPQAETSQSSQGVTIQTIYDSKTPFAVVLSDGRKASFFSESLLAEVYELKSNGDTVGVKIVENRKGSRVFQNLERIWAADTEPVLPMPPDEDLPPLPDDDDLDGPVPF